MFLYLIDCVCENETGDVWSFKTIVKAKNAIDAWDMFMGKWRLKIKTGMADMPPEAVIKYSVEKVCPAEEDLL